jgi:type IV secretion system protein VirB10
MLGVMVMLIAYGISSSGAKQAKKHSNEPVANNKLEAASDIAYSFYKDIPNSRIANVKSLENAIVASELKPKHKLTKELTPEQELVSKLKEQQIEDAIKARSAHITYEAFTGDRNINASVKPYSSSPVKQGGENYTSSAVDSYKQLAELHAAKEDQSKQARKERFLKEAANNNDDHYLSSLHKEAISPYEVKAGQIIPAIMISGINSDLPGQLIAQVRENVYDARSGNYLLLPQGTKLIGTYDSQIAYGQERVLIVWNRMIFPDASSMDLKAMPGSDISGYAGFADQIDNHYLRTFGGAVLMSVISAGAQLSQPQISANNGQTPSASQTVTASVGSQLGQTGNLLVQKNMNVQPTIKIRPGYLFNVMVTKDMILPGSYGN